jgi:hypothetical protein
MLAISRGMKNGESRLMLPGLDEGAVRVLDRRDAAHSDADDHAGPRCTLGRDRQPRVVDRHLCPGDRKLREAVDLFEVLLLEVRRRIEVAHLARDAHREVACIEGRDRPDTGAPGEERAPVGVYAASERAHDAETSHDDALCFAGHLDRHTRAHPGGSR